MSREFMRQDIVSLERGVTDMANHARGMLHDGVASLDRLDKKLADDVAGRREKLADMDESLERNALLFLTLQAPVAGDLRRIGTLLKLITYLNRVGRYGYDIAAAAQAWPAERGHVARMVNLREMATMVESMLDLALVAFKEHVVPDAEAVLRLEDDVDALRYSVWRECLTYMAEDSHNIEPCAHYMMVARYLERCGDNVCKMVEKLHYSATGDRLLLK